MRVQPPAPFDDAALMQLLQQRLEAKARRESARARPKSKFY
jgi:hypothetical protein